MDSNYNTPAPYVIEETIVDVEDELEEYARKSLRGDITLIEHAINSLVHSTVYLGITSASLAYATILLLGLRPDAGLILAFALISFSVYTMDKMSGSREDFINHIDRLFFIRKYKDYLLSAAFISYFMGLVIIYPLGYKAILFAFFPIISGLLYSIDWIPKSVTKKYGRLKEILLMKNVFIAASWTVTIVGLSLIYGKMGVTPAVACVSAFVGAKVFLNTIVFDLRDIEGDKRKNVRTIPLQIGKSTAISLLKLSNILLGMCLAAAIYLGFLPKIALFIGLVTVYTHWYLSQIGKIKINFLCDVLVEGEDIVMAALAFAGISLLG